MSSADSTDDTGAEEYKKKGNAAFQAQNWDEAIKNYNKAIQLDPKQAPFYSNRAACWSSKGNHESALADSKRCLDVDPSFVKGYSRKGKALFDMGKLDEAEQAFQEGLRIDASNAGCTSGLTDVRQARQAQRGSSSAGGSGGPSMFDGLSGKVGGFGKRFMQSMSQGGMGGRLQMYAVVMAGMMFYNNYVKTGTPDSGSSTHHDLDDDGGAEHVASSAADQVLRSFVDVDGSWISYLHTGARSDNMLLMLHSTSLSAESEYGTAITEIVDKATSSLSGGLRVVAPDRPCHGYSPCPAAAATGWFDSFSATRTKAKHLTIVASGRTATQQALALARDRTRPSRLLLVNPRKAPEAQKSKEAESALELHNSLAKRLSSLTSPAAYADAARWQVAASGKAARGEQDEEQAPVRGGLPEGCRVTALYSKDAKEDADLHEDLEGSGLAVEVRRADAVLEEAVVAEAWRLLTAGSGDASADQD